MSENLALSAADFRAAQLKTCIAALDLMTAETQKMLAELEPCAGHEHEQVKAERSSILQLYVARVDQSAETRCRNLRSTLRAIERERDRAQYQLATTLRADEN